MEPELEARNVCAIREDGTSVRNVSISFDAGSFNVLTGEPGCGKNLLLRIIALLDLPQRGDVLLKGQSTRNLPEPDRAALRNSHFGYLFAAPFLLPSFSIAENVAMPLFRLSGMDAQGARLRTERLLEFVGLRGAMTTLTGELSSAEQTRISLARGLAHEPGVLIVENVDELLVGDDLGQFVTLLRRACDEFGVCVVATASGALPEAEHRAIELINGAVRRDSRFATQLEA